MDQTGVSEGIGGIVTDCDSEEGAAAKYGIVNVRQKYIQGDSSAIAATTAAHFTGGKGFGRAVNSTIGLSSQPFAGAPEGATVRRYQISLGLGLFTQDKLIPTKFMASQLAIELTLEQNAGCIFVSDAGPNATVTPTYAIGNVNLIPEILNFDASYDSTFLQGLRTNGIPIKFSSW